MKSTNRGIIPNINQNKNIQNIIENINEIKPNNENKIFNVKNKKKIRNIITFT